MLAHIARFYDVDSGEVTVGGEDVRNMTCDSLLRNISMVFQKVYLFHDTIENNIRFGNPSATQEEIIEAAKKARCHDFIMALPDGYETVIGEGGSTLSGGEKQRISIARAILKNANIVILDEATASIDPENEHLIQQAISELTIGKTVIVIAHRLATIEHADQILVVDKGQVVQKGTHQQLVQQEGLYRRFITIREQAEGWSIAWYGDILTIFKIWKGGLAIYGGVIGGLGRFLIEGLRTDSLYIISGIRVSQVLSLFLIFGGILLYVFFVRRDKTKNVYSGRYIR